MKTLQFVLILRFFLHIGRPFRPLTRPIRMALRLNQVRYNRMAMLSRLACSSLLVLAATSALHAQNNPFNRATPDVEAALRARITGFFEAQQQGKWRQAQEFVSEESIDAYLERDKNRYASFEIQNLRWVGEAYKEAVVTMIVPYDMMVPGVGTVATAARWSWT